MLNADVPLITKDASCNLRVPNTAMPVVNEPRSITIYEDDILNLARIVYYFGYLFPKPMSVAYKTLKSQNDCHAGVLRDCITEPRLALCRIERLLLDYGYDIASLK